MKNLETNKINSSAEDPIDSSIKQEADPGQCVL